MNLDERRKEALWRLYARRTEREENRFKQTFHRCLWKQRDDVIVNLVSANNAEDALFDYKDAVRDFKDGFQPVIQYTVIEGAKQAIDLVEILKQFGAEHLSRPAHTWISSKSLTLAKGVNRTTRPALRRSLAEGFKAGESMPQLTKRVNTLYNQRYKRHAGTVARTETIRASNYGALQGYNEAGVEKVEFYVSLDERTCEECEALSGKYFKPDEADGLIPVHPNCRCTFLPVIPEAIREEPVKPEGLSDEDWVKSLSSDERRALDYWQGSGYEKIRIAQQTGKAPASIKGAVKNINTALDRAKTYDGQVFRGLNRLDKKTFNLLKNSKEIKWNALSSSAKTEKAAARFLRAPKGDSIMFKIQSKTGIDLSAVYKQEAEVLLRKNASYRVIGQSEKVYTVGRERVKALEMVLAEI